MSEITYPDLDWLQNGEPVTGGTTSAPSAGVMNRPLLELQQNVTDVNNNLTTVEGEINDAKGDFESLDDRFDDVDQRIETLEVSRALDNRSIEVNAEAMRARMPSAFDYNFYNEKKAEGYFDSSSRDNSLYRLVVPEEGAEGSLNKIGLVGTPAPLYVNGIKIILDQNPTNRCSAVIDLGEAPETGVRLDYVFLEVWKEKIKLGEDSDVLFPFGAVFFDSSEATFDGCQLESSNMSGTYSPEYLANATGHGKYVLATDDNVISFIEDTRNNVVMDVNGDYYQYRWRFRVAHNVAYPDRVFPWQFPDTVKAQGMRASSTNTSFSAVSDDVGLSVANLNTLALDGKCYAIPVAIVHRRNQAQFGLANMNGAGSFNDGASTRPDGKFYDVITLGDMLDLRQHSIVDGNFNLSKMVRRNQAKLFSSTLDTVFEEYMADPDGNGEYVGTGIYGTDLLRADVLTGSSVIESTWQVQTKLTAQNGITSRLDGYRAYFGNLESEGAVTGYIPNINQSSIDPNIFTYNATNHQITFNASAMDSGNTNNPGLAGRTLVSNTEPVITYARVVGAMTGATPTGSWSGLGTDVATFTMEDKSYFVCRCNSASGYTVVLGDTYTSTNGVTCTVVGFTSDYLYTAFEFSGSDVPTGTLTQATGTGTLTSINTLDSGTGSNNGNPNPIFQTSQSIEGLSAGAVYTDPNGVQCTVQNILRIGSTNRLELSYSSSVTTKVGTFTKVSGDGPATIVSTTFLPNTMWTVSGANGSLTSNKKCGYGLAVSDCQLFITVYVKFTSNSGIQGRLPYQNNTSLLGCQHIIGANQVLPHNGYGFLPVGYGDTEGFDSHTRTFGLQHFLYNEPVIRSLDLGDEVEINAVEVIHPSDQNIFMMYLCLKDDGVYYCESEDGMSWSTPTKVVNTTDNYLAIKLLYEGSASASAFKMMLTKYVSTTDYEQQYCYSADGHSWSTPVTVLSNDGYYSTAATTNTGRLLSFKEVGTTYEVLIGGFETTDNVIHKYISSDCSTWTKDAIDNINTSIAKFSEEIVESTIERVVSPTALAYTYITSEVSFHVANEFSISTIKTGKYTINAGASTSCSVVKGEGAYNMWFVDKDSDTGETRIWYTILANRDPNQTGYEDRNVSATQGQLDIAPSLGSIVVIFYKAKAEQTDRGLAEYVDDNAVCTSLGCMNDEGLVCTDDDSSVATTDNGVYIPYRDVLCGAVYPDETISNKQNYSNAKEIEDPNTVTFLDSHFSNTDAMFHTLIKSNIWGNDMYVGEPEDLTISYVDSSCGVDMNISDIPYNSLISQARAMQEDASEYVAELFKINKRMYLISAKNTGSYAFNTRVKPSRPLGNPIFK